MSRNTFGKQLLSIYPSIFLPINQSILMPIYPSTYLSLYLSISLPINLSTYLSLYLSFSLCIYLYISPCLSFFVCIYLFLSATCETMSIWRNLWEAIILSHTLENQIYILFSTDFRDLLFCLPNFATYQKLFPSSHQGKGPPI